MSRGVPIRAEDLVCPESGKQLSLLTMAEAVAKAGAKLLPVRGESTFKECTHVLLRDDKKVAYPVIYGIPVLLLPEMLVTEGEQREIDIGDPRYAEAYEEMEYYNQVASKEAENIKESPEYKSVTKVYQADSKALSSFPNPRSVWIDAVYDCAAQWEAYEHISPIEGKRVLQLGGKGTHAVKFLVAGAKEAWLATPMMGEALCAIAMAKEFGVADRLYCVVSVGEELPLRTGLLDVVYSGGCMHHMVLDLTLAEVSRVLKKGGTFSAVDPWRAPLYAMGTKIFGKREVDVYCRPLTKERVASLFEVFEEAKLGQHGTLTRYPLLALMKFGVSSSMPLVWRLNAIDDFFCSLIPGMRGMGSSIACLGKK